MRRDPDFFGDEQDQERLVLLYIAKKLKQAQHIEDLFTQAGIDYLVEPDHYVGGIIFRTERVGAFFYSAEESADAARRILKDAGFRPYDLPQEAAENS